ncbi:dTDP-glucose 4,6-dehydratase [Bifidobacterium crudilactis]|jgi:dTDP-glucose 4,6-dehydratase|uniref:dTDP-glucose 4,6-dehydratase n=1 Tax=Bifidobacterium crudilactis TaxID=327277 RepID=UPI00054F2BF7|nr:dTDP-glucose 4,6-dehydratase [Bifidobacterium crudilactis]MCI2148716.1 dTDP-glucose 4,6-dehydratase [Bifidobacterium crudilactis]MCI2156976.1 dTDP-glucose 4,6-dehydratase [Bifidobacterium crudilactis]
MGSYIVPRHVLVTGGAGFIGSNFVRYVADCHPEVHITVLDALTYAANTGNLVDIPAEQCDFVHGDIRDADLVDEVVASSDAVVHFAAESHNDNAISDPAAFVSTNVEGTFVLLESVRRHDVRFHHISTDEVYGDLDYDDKRAFTEESPYRPSNPYSASKAASDHLVRAWIRTYGIRATISNSSNNFGSFQHVEKFIPRQITNILCGERPKLYGVGREVRDWISVSDHCLAVWEILTRGDIGQTYLVSAGNELSNAFVLASILDAMGMPSDYYDTVPNRVGVDKRYALDSSKIRTLLGWRPADASFHQSLLDTIQWYANHRDWWMPSKTSTEQRYRNIGR